LAKTIGIDARKLGDFGIGTYIENLIRALAAVDRENRYVLFVGPNGREILDDLPQSFELVLETSPVYSIRELIALSRKAARYELDLYHATHYVLPAVLRCNVVVTIHDIIHLLYPEFLPNRLAFLYAQRMIRRSLTRGDRILADSWNTKSDLMSYFETDGRKIEVVYPGVADLFRQRLDPEEIRAVLARHQIRRPYILFVGNPKPHKNLNNVLDSFAEVVRRDAFAGDLICVGGRDENQHRIAHHAQRLGIEDRVLLLGHVPEESLPAIYQGAALFLYPTLYEGFGLPVVEAMASGVPVVTSNTSSLKEVAEGYAHLVDPLDVPQMTRAVIDCLQDDERRRRLIRAGYERADQFHWQGAAEQTLAVYKAAICSGPADEVAP
jgi:glycosyltransferase involved in cell wall biosynthesis